LQSIRELAPRIRNGAVSPVALTEEYLQRIERLNPTIDAYITVLRESSLEAAEKSERLIREGRYLGPLHGVPMAIKDVIAIKGVRCTAGSSVLENYVPESDAPAVRKIRSAGGIILGTANLHEFASGVTSANPYFGAVKNPHDTDRIAGGSSGGSAAAVAAGMAIASLGTDTSGSVRTPAALCGVTGLKPTYGRISREGVIPLSESLDHVGIITRDSWDAAAVLEAIAGHDEGDGTTVDAPVPRYTEELEGLPPEIRVGVPRRYFLEVVADDVEDAFNLFLERLARMGVSVVDMEVKGIERIQEIWAPIRLGEAAAFHRRWFEATPSRYGDDLRKMIERGLAFSAVQYIEAQSSRQQMRKNFEEALGGVDVLATPTTQISAPRSGEEDFTIEGSHIDIYSALTKLTLPFNVVGLPAVTLPVEATGGRMPVGVQLAGRPFEESTILRLAHHYQLKFGLGA
jgi:aspartyl-tRNA(Asn)/glutamyl-tRNA(Gln) amidotransferase subunit A